MAARNIAMETNRYTYHLFVTCGTSLLGNAAKSLPDLEKKYNLSLLARAAPGSNEERRLWNKLTKKSELYKALMMYARSDPTTSAEIMAVNLYLKQVYTSGSVLVSLFHSDISTVTLAAWSIVGALNTLGCEIKAHSVPVLGNSTMSSDMINLMEGIVDTYTRDQAQHRVMLPIGGFKAEVIAAAVVGMLLGMDIYYVHESSRNLMKLPRVPITLKKDAFITDKEMKELFDTL